MSGTVVNPSNENVVTPSNEIVVALSNENVVTPPKKNLIPPSEEIVVTPVKTTVVSPVKENEVGSIDVVKNSEFHSISLSVHSEYDSYDSNDLEECIRYSEEMADDGDSTQGKPGSPDIGPKAYWNDVLGMKFIEVLLQKKEKFNLKGHSFRKNVWIQIAKEANSYLEVNYTWVQYKEKMRRLLNSYKIWHTLKSMSGLGWDEEKGTFMIDDWDALEQVCLLLLGFVSYNSLLGWDEDK